MPTIQRAAKRLRPEPHALQILAALLFSLFEARLKHEQATVLFF